MPGVCVKRQAIVKCRSQQKFQSEFKDFIFFAKRHVYYKFPTKRNQKPPNQMFRYQQPSNPAIFSKCLPLFLKDQFLEKRLLIVHV